MDKVRRTVDVVVVVVGERTVEAGASAGDFARGPKVENRKKKRTSTVLNLSTR